MASEQSQNEKKREYQIDEITYAKGKLLLMRTCP